MVKQTKRKGACSEWKGWRPLETFNLVLPCFKRLCTFVLQNKLEKIDKKYKSLVLIRDKALASVLLDYLDPAVWCWCYSWILVTLSIHRVKMALLENLMWPILGPPLCILDSSLLVYFWSTSLPPLCVGQQVRIAGCTSSTAAAARAHILCLLCSLYFFSICVFLTVLSAPFVCWSAGENGVVHNSRCPYFVQKAFQPQKKL